MQANIYIKIDDDNPLKDTLKKGIESYGKSDPDKLIYCISHPLIGEEEYEYGYDGVLLMSPNNKLIFIGHDNSDAFKDFVDDFISDIGALSQNYGYQKYINAHENGKTELPLQKFSLLEKT